MAPSRTPSKKRGAPGGRELNFIAETRWDDYQLEREITLAGLALGRADPRGDGRADVASDGGGLGHDR